MNKELGKFEFPTSLIKEGLTEENIYEYSFLIGTIATGVEIPARGYKFLSVLTNGAFNPFNNYTCMNMQCYLGFNSPNKYKLSLNREYRNIPIPYINKIYWHNHVGTCREAVPANTMQSGYGGVFIILHNYPLTTDLMTKNNPYVCEENINLDTGYTETIRWIGMNRPNATWALALPWLPIGYRQLTLHVMETGLSANWNFYVQQYAPCSDTLLSTIIATAADQLVTFNNVYSNRFKIHMSNSDVGNAAIFHYNITFQSKDNAL